MPRVRFLRGIIYGGRACAVGDIMDVPEQDFWIVAGRVEVLSDEPTPAELEPAEPERATLTTAEAAGVIARKRGRPRKR